MSATLEERTIPEREGEELDRERVLAFLRREIPELPDGPLEVRQFPTGSSNLTYLIRVDAWRAVLRRPPHGPVPPKAHDMVREAKVLRRLHPVFPLAPDSLAVCQDESVLGAPFQVMEFRDGVVVDSELPEGLEPTREVCRRFARRVLDTLVELHAVDYREAGLDEIGHPEGFLERQTRGWIGRWERAKTEDVEDLPEADPLTEWLADHVPESPEPTVIHNDFHLRNLLWDPDDPLRLTAVLDWEMTTVGDPLMDLAVFLSYWRQEDDPGALAEILATVTAMPEFPTRGELMERYARASGRDLSRMEWYLPFAYFKLAVILQQIYARWVHGQTKDPRFSGFGTAVRQIVEHAWTLARREGGA